MGHRFAFLTVAGMFAVAVWRLRRESSGTWTNEEGRSRWGQPEAN
jgi:hypothetical protein